MATKHRMRASGLLNNEQTFRTSSLSYHMRKNPALVFRRRIQTPIDFRRSFGDNCRCIRPLVARYGRTQETTRHIQSMTKTAIDDGSREDSEDQFRNHFREWPILTYLFLATRYLLSRVCLRRRSSQAPYFIRSPSPKPQSIEKTPQAFPHIQHLFLCSILAFLLP